MRDEFKDIGDDLSFLLIREQKLLILAVIVSEWRIPAIPITALASLSNLVGDALLRQLPLPLSER
ncbi:MAG TPA: hypothetical protein DCX06_13075 [Opitutae bacterium]|nr:hypothetical protein [Opitutae bacterium]